MRLRRLSRSPALRLLPLAALAGLLIALAPGASASSTTTFSASADTYVDSGTPTTNYGGAASLHADGSPAKWSLLRFKVANLSGSVVSAKLQVYSTSSSTSGFDVHRTS